MPYNAEKTWDYYPGGHYQNYGDAKRFFPVTESAHVLCSPPHQPQKRTLEKQCIV